MKAKDITEEYLRNVNPNNGIISHDEMSEASDRNVSEFLYKNIGGNIRTLQVENIHGRDLSTPDAIWNDIYWEYKNITSIKSIDNRIKQAWHQLKKNAERKGLENRKVGIVIDISKRKQGFDETIAAAKSTFEKRINYPAELIIIENERIIRIFIKE